MATLVAFHAHPDDEVILTGCTLAAHRSQIGSSGPTARLFGVLLALPPEVVGLLFPHEWFVDPASSPGTVRRDIFD